MLTNLSQYYLDSGCASLCDRVRMFFHPELYAASSLADIREGFVSSPPRGNRAFVVMYDLGVKGVDAELFCREPVSLNGLDDGLCFPLFELHDNTHKWPAYWNGGGSRELLDSYEKFGFCDDGVVKVPKVFLGYSHRKDGSGGSLLITGFKKDDIVSRDKSSISLREKLSGLFPSSDDFLPAPA